MSRDKKIKLKIKIGQNMASPLDKILVLNKQLNQIFPFLEIMPYADIK